MRRLLVAVDGSEPSDRACVLAGEMARRFEAKLTLVHVATPLPYLTEGYTADFRALAERDRKESEAMLQRAQGLLRGSAVEVAREILWGSPGEMLVEASKEQDVDCVVVGSSGRNAAARLFLGSTSNHLVHFCAKPVLVVR